MDLQVNTTTSTVYPPFINDSNLMSPPTIQTKLSFGSVYIAGLFCLALTTTLGIGALILLLTQGKKGLWMKLRSRLKKEDSEQARHEEGVRHSEFNQNQTSYTSQSISTSTSHYRTGLHPILEEPEEAEDSSIGGERSYSTGLVARSESFTSSSSSASLASLKTEEDIVDMDFHRQIIARRLRKWADPGEETRSFKSNATFIPSTTCDTFKLGWDAPGDGNNNALFEVKKAIAQNIEMTKARLVLIGLSASKLQNGETASSRGSISCSSEDHCDSDMTLSCSTLSSVVSSSLSAGTL